MACDAVTVPGVTRGHVVNFLEQGAKIGLPNLAGQGDHGEASQSGVTVRWDFDEAAGTLTVQCIKSPMLLPCSMINTRIQQMLAFVTKQDTARERA